MSSLLELWKSQGGCPNSGGCLNASGTGPVILVVSHGQEGEAWSKKEDASGPRVKIDGRNGGRRKRRVEEEGVDGQCSCCLFFFFFLSFFG